MLSGDNLEQKKGFQLSADEFNIAVADRDEQLPEDACADENFEEVHILYSPRRPSTPEQELRDKCDAIDLCRKALPTLMEEPNVCSICLDEFTDSDPAVATVCSHSYHLQCIMQWAQRSRECPLCFKDISLKDESLNELLPFGEYISPQQQAAALASFQSWELERLLVRIAASSQRRESRGERQRSSSRPIPSRHIATSQEQSVEAVRPGSWPPSGTGEVASTSQPSSSFFSPGIKSASQSLRSRFASLNIKESLSKTTKELKQLLGGGNSPP